MMAWLKRVFCDKLEPELHAATREFERVADQTKGVHEEAMQRIKQVTSRVTLAQSGNCNIQKLLKEMGR